MRLPGLGTTHLDVDAWGIDVIIGGSQKALMIPPGLAYGAISERAWQRMETTKSPRYYFDLRKEREVRGQGRIRPIRRRLLCLPGLAAAFDYVRQMGDGNLAAGPRCLDRERRIVRRHDSRWSAGAGFAGARFEVIRASASSSGCAHRRCRVRPAQIPTSICKRFRDQFGAVVANGQAEMKGQLFPHSPTSVTTIISTPSGLLAALEQVIAETDGDES